MYKKIKNKPEFDMTNLQASLILASRVVIIFKKGYSFFSRVVMVF